MGVYNLILVVCYFYKNFSMAKFEKNISRLYLIKISKWFNLVMPVVVLFYQNNGMGMQEIFTLKAIYSVAIVGMEVPSGWMADVWGRKKTLLWPKLFWESVMPVSREPIRQCYMIV
jgi:MFS family permease